MARSLGRLSGLGQSVAPATRAALRLLLLVGFGLVLGACSKCDVPTWQHAGLATPPAACHDGPQAQ